MNKTFVIILVLLIISFAQENFNTKYLNNTNRSDQHQNNTVNVKRDGKQGSKHNRDKESSSNNLTEAQKELVKTKFDQLTNQHSRRQQMMDEMEAFAEKNGINIQLIKKFLYSQRGDGRGKQDQKQKIKK